MRKIETEILIVGAGPSGATTSIFLSKNKIPHIIVDKAVFPRDKICGDALSGKVVQELKRIDPEIISQLENDSSNFTGSYGVQFSSPSGHSVDIPFSTNLNTLKHAPGFISRRFQFDNFLARKIVGEYSTFFEDTELLVVKRTSEGLIAELNHQGEKINIHTKLLVSSEGERTRSGRQLGLYSPDDSHFCAGVRAYYKGVRNMHPKNFIELHFLPELIPGYFWIFPLPDGYANIGIGMLSREIKLHKISLRKKLDDIIHNHPKFKDRFNGAIQDGQVRGWGLPLGSKRRKLSTDNFILTGDAASLIDPFTGEGIGNAMISGRLAAETIAESVKKQCYTKEFLSEYDKKLYLEIRKELRLSHTLQRMSSQKWLFNWVVKKASTNVQLRELITGMFEDIDMRSKLSKPGFYFEMLFKK